MQKSPRWCVIVITTKQQYKITHVKDCTPMRKKSTGFANKFRRNHKTKRMVRMLDEICVELDYRALYRAYSRKLPKGAASPEDMFRILVYGYMTGNYSSRKIEEACRSNINFM